MLAKLEEIRLNKAFGKDDAPHPSRSDTEYARAFRDYGIDVEALPVEEAAARIRAQADRRPSGGGVGPVRGSKAAAGY